MTTATATRQPKTYPRLTREATDPTTPPARLAYLSSHHNPAVKRLALANPALPAARLTEALRFGLPAAWGNPAALWALLEMPPAEAQEGAVLAATELARCRTRTAATEPPYVVTEAMASLLRPQLLAAWEGDNGGQILEWVARYAQMCGPLSPQHHQSTLLMCLARRLMLVGMPDADLTDIDAAEAFAWSGTTDTDRQSAMLDASLGRDITGYAAVCDPRLAETMTYALRMRAIVTVAPKSQWSMRANFKRGQTDDLADLLRAAMPVPMWLAEADPSHG